MQFIIFLPQFYIRTAFNLNHLKPLEVVTSPLLELLLLTHCHLTQKIQLHHLSRRINETERKHRNDALFSIFQGLFHTEQSADEEAIMPIHNLAVS
jgi:hypothetical protein